MKTILHKTMSMETPYTICIKCKSKTAVMKINIDTKKIRPQNEKKKILYYFFKNY